MEEGAFYYDNEAAEHEYHSGQFYVKLLKYEGPSDREQHTLSFPFLKDNLTLGDLVDVGIHTKLYKFVFFLYRGLVHDQVWKGCRDFRYISPYTFLLEHAERVFYLSLQYWLLLIRAGYISQTSNSGDTLTAHMPYVYDHCKVPRYQLVEKGYFVCFDRDEDPLVYEAYYGWI